MNPAIAHILRYKAPAIVAAADPDATVIAAVGANLRLLINFKNTSAYTLSGTTLTGVTDRSPGNLTPTISGSPVYDATGLNGGPCLILDGTDDKISFASASMGVSAFSAHARASITTGFTATTRLITFEVNGGFLDLDNTSARMITETGNDSFPSFKGFQGGDALGFQVAAALNTAYSVDSIFDGSNHTMYVDGVGGTPVADTDGSLGATGTFVIGSNVESGSFYLGKLVKLLVTAHAPSGAELTAIRTWLGE